MIEVSILFCEVSSFNIYIVLRIINGGFVGLSIIIVFFFVASFIILMVREVVFVNLSILVRVLGSVDLLAIEAIISA